ncbi:MAG: NAD(P)-binding protein, partial [Acidobacteria bacterium]|nr:NAD(P)-binding protein [Acidobacteriota bacterium]
MNEAVATETELEDLAPALRKKVAVLGGGCGSMAAVWALTRLPDWEQKFDITVHQMGWRLGGKGASGREAAQSQRILEHGLHVWGGFYDNAFRVMQEAYGELDPAPENPIRDWTDAFRKLGNVILEEEVDGEWISWYLDLPENDAVPGHGGEIPSLWDYVRLVINFLEHWLRRHGMEATTKPLTSHTIAALHSAPADGAVPLHAMTPDSDPESPHLPRLHDRFHPHDIVTAAKLFAESLPDDTQFHAAESHHTLIHMLEEALLALEARAAADPALAGEAAALRRDEQRNAEEARRLGEDAVRQSPNDVT